MSARENQCPNCNADLKPDARFCPNCGTRAPSAERQCPHCQAPNPGSANFCASCGKALDAPSGQGALWRRAPNDFATKIALTGANLFSQPSLTIEEGTKALVFAEGRVVQELGAGTFPLGPEPPKDSAAHTAWRTFRAVLDKLGVVDGKQERPVVATAVLLDEGDVELTFEDVPAFTSDPIKLAVDAHLVVAVAEPFALFTNLLKGRANYSLDDLRADLSAEVRQALGEAVGRRSAFELTSHLELKAAIGQEVEKHLAETFGRYGLAFKQVRTLDFRHQVLDQQRQVQEELLLLATEQEAKNAGRRRLLDTMNEGQLQDIAQETKRTELREKRLANVQRLRRLALADRTDWFRYEFEARKAQLTASEELEELARAFSERKEDHELARRHLLRRLEMEQELELEALRVAREGELSEQELDQQLRAERARRQADLEDARARDLADLERQERRHAAALNQQLQQARNQAEADEIKLQLNEKKLRLAMLAAEQRAALDHKEESLRISRQRDEMLIEQEAADREAEREIARTRALSEAEQARLAADLQKTEALKDMTEDQILALMAKDSPHVAQAIAERYKAQAGAADETKALYERFLATRDAEADRLERLAGRALESAERIAGGTADRERAQKEEAKNLSSQAMDRMSDVAAARAGAPRPAEPPQSTICPQCQRQLPAGARFCDNCGHQLHA